MAANILAAVDEVAALLGEVREGKPISDLRDAGVKKVYDHEPTAVASGCSVSVAYTGQDALDYLIAVRLYVSDNEPRSSQRLLAAGIEAVDEALSDGHSGPSQWTATFDPTASVHYAESIQRVPRDSF